ncbi:unnamed protein product, partial [Adineta steineri]
LHYDRYDKKFGHDGQHEALTWAEVELGDEDDDDNEIEE